MNHPKHKPATLDMRRPGARNDLYGPGRWEGSRFVGWEGIEAAQARTNELPKEIARLIDKVRNRFYITGEHIEEYSVEKTRKLIAKIRALVGTNTKSQVEYAEQLRELVTIESNLSSQSTSNPNE